MHVKKNDVAATDEEALAGWVAVLNNMPAFYRGKDLSMIDSKLNEIIKQIKTTNHGFNTNTEQRTNGAI